MNIPYVCTLSPFLRNLMRSAQEIHKLTLQRMVEGVVLQIDGDEEVVASLKVPVDGWSARQVDLRAEPGSPILVKTFVAWDEEKNHYHVFVESHHEEYWEQQWNFLPSRN